VLSGLREDFPFSTLEDIAAQYSKSKKATRFLHYQISFYGFEEIVIGKDGRFVGVLIPRLS
jgi:hypothetical protein